MAKILVHITHGPEHPTRAALGFLVAKSAIDEGHTVTLFLAGDAVQLLRESVLDNLTGAGTDKLREHYDAIVSGGGQLYLSGMSSKARGLSEADVIGKPAGAAGAAIPIKFSLEGNQGLNIFATGYPANNQTVCNSSAPLDAIEQTVSAGYSSLSYDPATDTYTYTWKTNKSWAGTCRQLNLRLSDGSEHSASFLFR